MLLPALLFAAAATVQDPASTSAPEAPKAVPAEAPKSLSFQSIAQPFAWNALLPLTLEVDGLQVKSIFFNERAPKNRFLKGSTFGTRAQVEVVNTAKKPRIPGFAVAVFDEAGNLLGVATGGTKVGTVKPGETETFDLNFSQVKARLPKGAKFVLSVELRN